jgi:UDP-glucose 4-epimerase
MWYVSLMHLIHIVFTSKHVLSTTKVVSISESSEVHTSLNPRGKTKIMTASAFPQHILEAVAIG